MTPTRATASAGQAPMAVSARVYIGAVIAAGTLALGTAVPGPLPEPLLTLPFVAAMIVVSLFKLRLPLGDGHSTLSMAPVVDFAAIATIGPGAAMAIAAAGVIVQCLARVRRHQPWYCTAFSVAAVVLAVYAAGLVWAAAGETPSAVALLAAAMPYFAINSGLVAAAIALSGGTSLLRCWTRLAATAPSMFAGAAMVAAVEVATGGDAYLLLGAVALPAALCHAAHAAWFRRPMRAAVA